MPVQKVWKTSFIGALLVIGASWATVVAQPATDEVVIQQIKTGLVEYEKAESSLALARTAAVTAEVETELQKSKIIRDMRSAVLGDNCRFVPASGDVSGRTDTTAIQAAIDAVQLSIPQFCGSGKVLLAGSYYTNAPLVLGTAGSVSPPVAGIFSTVTLEGLGVARIANAFAAPSSNYMIRIYGSSFGSTPVLKNLIVWCSYKSRGVLCSGVSGNSSLENVNIRYSSESALDMIDCWTVDLRNVLIDYFRGFGLRTLEMNACHYDSVHFHQGYGIYSADAAVVSDANLVKYAMMNGGIAAKSTWKNTAYAAVAAESWPAIDDTMCTGLTGVPFRNAVAERGCVYLHATGSIFTNTRFESCGFVDYPLIYGGRYMQRNQFLGTYLEANRCMHEKVLLDSPVASGAGGNVFDGVAIGDGSAYGGSDYTKPLDDQACECFLRCRGRTSNNLVHRLAGTSGIGAGGHVVILDGGTHTGTQVTDCCLTAGRVVTAEWIGDHNSPTVVSANQETYGE